KISLNVCSINTPCRQQFYIIKWRSYIFNVFGSQSIYGKNLDHGGPQVPCPMDFRWGKCPWKNGDPQPYTFPDHLNIQIGCHDEGSPMVQGEPKVLHVADGPGPDIHTIPIIFQGMGHGFPDIHGIHGDLYVPYARGLAKGQYPHYIPIGYAPEDAHHGNLI